MNERISLYGHSAGGQFAARFIMMHPEVVESAVITSAGTYPQPDPLLDWPYGMGALHTEIVWDDVTVNHVDIITEEKNGSAHQKFRYR